MQGRSSGSNQNSLGDGGSAGTGGGSVSGGRTGSVDEGVDLNSSPNKRLKMSDNKSSRFRSRLRGPSKTDAESMAWCVGLEHDSLMEEERGIIPQHAPEDAYIHVRNQILYSWRENVSQYLTEEAAAENIEPRHRSLVTAAWQFLNRTGYINFGIAPDIVSHNEKMESANVIVIGAGLAGLSAAQQLKKFGCNVLVLEGRDRPGGRVYSRKMQSGEAEAICEIGGSVIYGLDGNPLPLLARQLNIPIYDINTENTPIYSPEGKQVDDQADSLVTDVFNNGILENCNKMRDKFGAVADQVSLGSAVDTEWQKRRKKVISKLKINSSGELEDQLFHWHCANLEFANAARLDDLSMKHWDQDDPYEVPGKHVLLPGGNIRLVKALCDGLQIIYNQKVSCIRYSKENAQVQTDTRAYTADAVVVTVPLGVLKRNLIKFEPPMPLYKQRAIQRLGFGVLNKVVFLFPYPFWGKNCDIFAQLQKLPQQRGCGFFYYSYANVSGGAVLVALVSGDAAILQERSPENLTVAMVLKNLRNIFEPQGVLVPIPIQAIVTKWGADEFSFGSYSSVAVGSKGKEDYEAMSENLAGKVYFAGEATTYKYPATMHGAYLSGLREAGNIIATLQKRRRMEGVMSGKIPANKSEEYIHDLLDVVQLMKFSFERPTMQVGSLKIIYGSEQSQYESVALVQLDVGKASKGKVGNGICVPVYFVMFRQALQSLLAQPSEEARIKALTTTCGIKLLNRANVGTDCIQILKEMIQNRSQVLITNGTNNAIQNGK